MCVSAARGVESAKARRHEAEMSLQSHINACKEKERQVDKAKNCSLTTSHICNHLNTICMN